MFANIFIFALFVCISQAGYAGPYGGNYVGGGAGGAGGFGYGYGGGFPPFAAPFYPPIPFDFGTLMAGTNAKAYTSVSVEPPFKGKISARARIIFHGLNQIQARLQEQAAQAPSLGNGGAYAFSGSYPQTPYVGNTPRNYAPPPVTNGHQGGGYNPAFATGFSGSYGGGYGAGYGTGYSGGYSGGFNGPYGNGFKKDPIPLSSGAFQGAGYGAGASAAIGGNGVEQKAFLSPENPASPNVNVRFAGSPPGGTSKSVFVSSSSSSGNINGTPYQQRHASTTVNDNGKVSTYTVHD